jgi:hypothetical protein
MMKMLERKLLSNITFSICVMSRNKLIVSVILPAVIYVSL